MEAGASWAAGHRLFHLAAFFLTLEKQLPRRQPSLPQCSRRKGEGRLAQSPLEKPHALVRLQSPAVPSCRGLGKAGLAEMEWLVPQDRTSLRRRKGRCACTHPAALTSPSLLS